MFFPPPPPPKPRCPECERLYQSERERFGFNIVDGNYYWTKIPEVKACCPVKVQVVESTSRTVTVTVNGKTFTKDRTDFLKSTLRDYDSF